jgi:hypothetical protein
MSLSSMSLSSLAHFVHYSIRQAKGEARNNPYAEPVEALKTI